jgi:putative colanic acid biosynthesis acetyltransferase WcaF
LNKQIIGAKMNRSLRSFTKEGYDKERIWIIQALWFAVSNLIFMKWWLPKAIRPKILRIFGGKIGERVFIRHNVKILWPWKLVVGDDCWLGEEVWILNLEPVVLGNDVCLSQRVMICTGNHDYKSSSFDYLNKPINIGHGVWIATQSLILPGVSIGKNSSILANVTVSEDIGDYTVVKRNH